MILNGINPFIYSSIKEISIMDGQWFADGDSKLRLNWFLFGNKIFNSINCLLDKSRIIR